MQTPNPHFLVSPENQWTELISKLKAENLKLRQENIKLQITVSEKDQTYRTEMAKLKEQSLKLIQEKEAMYEQQMQQRELEFKQQVELIKQKAGAAKEVNVTR